MVGNRRRLFTRSGGAANRKEFAARVQFFLGGYGEALSLQAPTLSECRRLAAALKSHYRRFVNDRDHAAPRRTPGSSAFRAAVRIECKAAARGRTPAVGESPELGLQSAQRAYSVPFRPMSTRLAIVISKTQPVLSGWFGRGGMGRMHKATRLNRRPRRARSSMTD